MHHSLRRPHHRIKVRISGWANNPATFLLVLSLACLDWGCFQFEMPHAESHAGSPTMLPDSLCF
jgi:hypothetical protein